MAEEINAGVVRLDMNPYLKALDDAIAKTDDWTSHLRKFQEDQKRPWVEMAEAQQRHTDKLRAQVAQIEQARQVQRELNNVAAEYAGTIRRLSQERTDATDLARKKQLTSEIRQQQRELEKVRTELRLNAAAIEQEKAAARTLTDERRQQVQQERLAAAARRDAAAAAKQEAAEAKQASAASASSTAGSTPSPQSGLFGGLFGGAGTLLSRLTPVALGITAINTAWEKAKEGFRNYSVLSGLQATLKALTGSSEEGAREFAYLKQQANDLGIELPRLAKAYTGLYAAGKEANLSGQETRAIFEAITAEAKVLQKSDVELEQALRAVQQMLSKGKVSAEELRGQLGEVLPDATAKAAKALGVSTAELDKMLKKGSIVAKDFLPKFAAEIQKTYGAATADAATQFRSNISRINTFIDETTAKIGQLAAPVVKYFADLVGAPAKVSDRLKAELTDLDILRQKLSETNVGQKERVELIQELQRQYPEYLGNLNAEKATNEQLSAAIDKVSESLVNRIILQQEDEKIAEQAAETAKKRLESIKAEQALRGQLLEIEKQNERQRSAGAKRQDAQGNTRPAVSIREEVNGIGRLDVQAREALTLIQQRQAGLAPTTSSVLGLRDALEAYQKAQIALAAEEEKGNDIEAEKRSIMQALGIEHQRLAGHTNANAAAQKGYIEQLREEIKALVKQRDELPKTAPDYLGKIDELNGQIAAKQEELRKLENRADKGAKTRENQLEAARKALLAREQKLQEAHDKSLLEQQRFNGELRAKEQLRQDLAEIVELEEQIKKAEQLVAKRGGKGAEADAKLSKEQQQLVNNLTADARRRFGETLAEIDRQTNARIMELQRDSDAKELAQLRAKFDEEIRVAKLAQNERLQVELEGAKQRAEAELIRNQAARKIREEEQFRLNAIERGEKFTRQTVDVTADQSMSPELNAAKQENIFRKLLANAAVDIEKQKQRDILQAKIEAQEKLLALYANDASDEALIIQDNAKTLLNGLRKELDRLNTDTSRNKPFNLLKALGVDEKDADEINSYLKEAKQSIFDSLNSIFQAEVDAAQKRVDARTQHIGELQTQLSQEIELFKSGAASNIGSLREQIAQEKAARQEERQQQRQALESQKNAQRAQLLLDTVTQASNLATASSNIYAGTSKLDIIFPGLGVATGTAIVGTLIGAFVYSKIKALQAINQMGKGSEAGFFTGGFTGGTSIHEERGVVHGKEHVMDHKGTAKYGDPLLEPLRLGRPQDVDWRSQAMQDLLRYAPEPQLQMVLPNYDLPRQMQQDQQRLVILQQQQSLAPLQQGLAKMEGRLGAIEQHVAATANRPDVVGLREGQLVVRHRNGNEQIVNYPVSFRKN